MPARTEREAGGCDHLPKVSALKYDIIIFYLIAKAVLKPTKLTKFSFADVDLLHVQYALALVRRHHIHTPQLLI